MRVLASEQISSNRRFSKQYSRENSKSKTKKQEDQSFHKLLKNEQNRLEEQNK